MFCYEYGYKVFLVTISAFSVDNVDREGLSQCPCRVSEKAIIIISCKLRASKGEHWTQSTRVLDHFQQGQGESFNLRGFFATAGPSMQAIDHCHFRTLTNASLRRRAKERRRTLLSCAITQLCNTGYLWSCDNYGLWVPMCASKALQKDV